MNNEVTESGPLTREEKWELLKAYANKARLLNESDLGESGNYFGPNFLSISLNVGLGFAIVFVVLACIAIILNGLILSILCQHHRHVFKHVFYILIVNFTVIDILKSGCLVLWAMKIFRPAGGSILIFKIDQISLIVLRFCNLGTILNLLMITLNEYIFIKYPLRYRSLVTKQRAMVLVFLSWFISWTFTVSTMLARSRQHSFLMGPCNVDMGNSTETTTDGAPEQNTTLEDSTPSNNCIHRLDTGDSLNVQYVILITLIAFCAICLVVVVVCYAIFFRVIHTIQKQDTMQFQEYTHPEPRQSINSELFAGDQRRINRQLLRRHKYVLVIGSVILIYVIYLVSYSAIQILQFSRLSRAKFKDTTSLIISWSLQTMIGLHSIFQPLCYFRMKEFRHFIERSLGYPCKKQGSRRDSAPFISENGLQHPRASRGPSLSPAVSNEKLDKIRRRSSDLGALKSSNKNVKRVKFGTVLTTSLRRQALLKEKPMKRQNMESII